MERKKARREKKVEDDQILALINEDSNLTLDEYALALGITKSTLSRRLKALDYTCKKTRWVPHQLTELNKVNRVKICLELLERQKKDPFLDRFLTCDEKWICYENVTRRNEWSFKGNLPSTVAKPGLHPKKVMLSVWWDIKGIVYSEYLNTKEKINAVKYQQQIDRVYEALKEKRPRMVNRKEVFYHQDNARPHTAKTTIDKIASLGWKLVPHPPYSPDIAPCDFYLFRSLQSDLNGNSFMTFAQLQSHVQRFFDKKPASYYKAGIYKLPELWKKIVENKGEYL